MLVSTKMAFLLNVHISTKLVFSTKIAHTRIFYLLKSDDTTSERSFNQVQQNRPKIELIDIFNYFFDKLPAPVQSTYNITQQTYDSEFSNHVRRSYSKLETLHRGSNLAAPGFR